MVREYTTKHNEHASTKRPEHDEELIKIGELASRKRAYCDENGSEKRPKHESRKRVRFEHDNRERNPKRGPSPPPPKREKRRGTRNRSCTNDSMYILFSRARVTRVWVLRVYPVYGPRAILVSGNALLSLYVPCACVWFYTVTARGN